MDILAELLDKTEAYLDELPASPPALRIPGPDEMAGWIDYTLLRPEATAEEIKNLCAEARQYRFASVCINPAFVQLAAHLLEGSQVQVNAVVAFPLGATLPTLKVIETMAALSAGATEIDMVLNIGALRGGSYGQVLNEIQAVAEVAHNQRAMLKVALETALLNREEKILACLISQAAGADFVKTSTGFGPGGATVEDVQTLRRVAGAEIGVKASGGIRDLSSTVVMIQAGANRIGTSAGTQIVHAAATEGVNGYER